MKPASLFVGYHGCDRAVAEQVLRDGRGLKASENAYDWLGHGIYFWENDPRRALQWAEFQKTRGKLKDPSVLGAYIQPANCLDLTEQASLDLIAEAYESLKADADFFDCPMPENKPAKKTDSDLLLRELDCAVINRLYFKRKDAGLNAFDAVRGPFWEGDSLYPGARIQRKTHIQIAVRDESAIIGYFRPGATR